MHGANSLPSDDLQFSVPLDHSCLLIGLPVAGLKMIGLPCEQDFYRPCDLLHMLQVRKAMQITTDIYH